MSGWRKGGREGTRGRERRERGERERKGRDCGGKVLNRVCRLVNITLTRSIAASGIPSFSSVFFCVYFLHFFFFFTQLNKACDYFLFIYNPGYKKYISFKIHDLSACAFLPVSSSAVFLYLPFLGNINWVVY